MSIADNDTRNAHITGLRQLADYLDTHPDVPVSSCEKTIQYSAARYEHGGREEVDAIAAALGVQVQDDTADGGHYLATRTFGLITYVAVAIPEAVMARHRAFDSYYGSVIPDAATAA